MECIIPNLNISAVAAALPKQEFDLSTLGQQFGEKEVARVISGTGISKIRIASPGLRCSDLCLAASENLIKRTALDKESIDALIFVSQTPDQMMPATSNSLSDRLGLSEKVITLDINQGCAGYIYGLYMASTLIAAGGCQRVLLCVGDVITPHLDPNDHQVRLVFGDAGTATLIEKGHNELAFSLYSDGSGGKYLHKYHEHLYMDGKKIMEFALRVVEPAIDAVLKQMNWSKEEVGQFILHQANKFMVCYLQKQLRVPNDKVPVSVEGVGNTGPASIPLLLSREYSSNNINLEKTVLCGFGVGLTWGAVAGDLSETTIISPMDV